MLKNAPTWLFPALTAAGALLVLIGLIQHFVLQVQILHIAVYVLILGIILLVVGLIGLFVVPTRKTESTN